MNIIKEKWNRGTDKPYDMTLRKVREDLRISGDAYRLYVTLYNSNTNPENGKVFTPSTESLATQFKTSGRTIKRWLKELKRYGYISITGTQEGGYTMIINKESKGVFKIEGDKFDTYKSKKKVTEMSPLRVTNLSPIIETIAAPPQAGSSNCQQGVQRFEGESEEDYFNRVLPW